MANLSIMAFHRVHTTCNILHVHLGERVQKKKKETVVTLTYMFSTMAWDYFTFSFFLLQLIIRISFF